MLKYAKIENEATSQVQVGLGDPEAIYSVDRIVVEQPSDKNPDGVFEEKTKYVKDWYEELGMSLMDVEQGVDGCWYLAGKTPATKVVRTFSKFAIWTITSRTASTLHADRTMWDDLEQFLENENIIKGWEQLVDLVEDNEMFILYYNKAVAQFGKAVVDGILENSVVSSVTVLA